MNISERLKIHTSANHQKLEKSIVGLIRGIENERDYIYLLGLFYGYLAAVEDLIDKYIPDTDLPDKKESRKVVHIAEDINALNGFIPDKANTFLPKVGNRFAAFGALYVIEGSTLGGVHISAMIQKKLPDIPFAFRFFIGYGVQTLYNWEKFKTCINELTEVEAEISMVLSAADETFSKFGEWIQYANTQPLLT
jgi:heme oxygenase (biliverdin-IX-beta and delta-forming)